MRTKYSKCCVVSLFHHFCVEKKWRRRILLSLIRHTSNPTHELLPIYLYILPLSLSQHIRLPSSALRPRIVPSKPTVIHLPLNATTDSGRPQCSKPAHIFGQTRVDTRHPIMALNPQASRSIARHREVDVACLRSCTVEEPNIPVKWEDIPVPISYTLAQYFRGWNMRTDTTPPFGIILWGGAGGNLNAQTMIFFLQWHADWLNRQQYTLHRGQILSKHWLALRVMEWLQLGESNS